MLRGRSPPTTESVELRYSYVRLLRLVIFAYALLLLPFSLVTRNKGANALRGTATTGGADKPPQAAPAASSSASSSYSTASSASVTSTTPALAYESSTGDEGEAAEQAAATDNKSSDATAFSALMLPSCVLLCLAFSAIRRMRRLEQFLSDHRHGHTPYRPPPTALLFGGGLGGRSSNAMGGGLVELLGRDPRNARLAERLRLLMTDRDFDGDDYSELLRLDDGLNNDDPGSSHHRKATPSEIRRLPTLVLSEAEVERMRQQGRADHGASDDAVDEERIAAGSKQGKRLDKAVVVHSRCAVCLAPWAAGDEVRTLPCLHRLHTDCIDPWLKQNATCPVCKYPAVG